MKKISIIVPIYNIEKYIEECVDSIIKQKYKNYELILVDDGSTDNSGKIIDKYLKIENVKVVHKKNGGLSDARNCGINKSTGEYLMFIDGDDFLLDENCLNYLDAAIDNNPADIIQYKMVYYYQNSKKYIYGKEIENIEGNIMEKLNILNQNGQISVSACDKIVKSSIIKDNNLFFEKGLLSEDLKWSYLLYLKIHSIYFLNKNIYAYRQQRENSITTAKGQKHARDLFEIIKYWLDYPYKNKKIKEIYYNMISYWYLILRVNFKKSYFSDEMKKFFKENDPKIICYHENYKVNLAYKLKKIVGFRFTIYILKFYIFLKNKRIVKL